MGELVQEFEATLAAWQERYRARPRREIERLLLLALEREQLVSVAYREEILGPRIDALGVPVELKPVLRHALAWAWKDEEMHAVFTRGLLLRLGSLHVRVLALFQQMQGAVGGWASSVQQHVRWSQAPFSRALAALISATGKVLGKVPRGIARQLSFRSFREFCELQVDAERTAAACWQRLCVLSNQLASAPPGTAQELARMAGDEARHERVFGAIAGMLDERDALRADTSETALLDALREAGEFFLPRERRGGDLAAHPLGRGGPVHVVQGNEESDKRALFRRVLEDAGLGERLDARAAELGVAMRDLRVLIKATFQLGYHRADRSIVTDPELVDELARFLRERGVGDVVVAEGPNLYDRFHERRGVHEVARYFGYASPHYRVVDLSEDEVPHAYPRGMAQQTLARAWRDAHFRIAFAKLRSHPVDFTHLALAGLQGVGARLEEFLFAERQAQRGTALLMPCTEFPPHFALIDGFDSAADGLVGIIACPDAPRPRRLYAGADALAVDLVASRHIGLADPRRDAILGAAVHWFGDPTTRTVIVGTDEPVPGWRTPYARAWWRVLALAAYPMYQFASGRGALFLPPMDEEAFPARSPPSASLRAKRKVVRALLGMRTPG